MKIKKHGISPIFVAVFMTTLATNSFSCPGCSIVNSGIDSASASIQSKFDSAMSSIASKYESDIVPTLEENRKIQKKLTKGFKRLELLEREMLFVNMEISQVSEEIEKIQRVNEVGGDINKKHTQTIKKGEHQ